MYSGLKPVRLLPRAKDSLITHLYLNEENLFAVGERGHIFNGKAPEFDLSQLKAPARQFLNAITGDGKGRLWCVGHDSIILFSGDNGNSFRVQYYNPEIQSPIFDIIHISRDELVAVGAFGLYLHTIDGGENWKKVMVNEEEPHIYDADPGKDGRVYLAGEFGCTMSMKSDGTDVQFIDTGVESTFFGIELAQNGEFFTYGLRGRIYHYDGSEMRLLKNDSKATIFGSVQRGTEIVFFGADGALFRYFAGKLQSRSLKERISITDAVFSGSELILSTSEGIRKVLF